MNFRRFLRPEAIRLELRTRTRPAPAVDGDGEAREEAPADFDPLGERNLDRIREEVVEELAELFDTTGAVANRTRLARDLHHREKKAGTAVGGGVALPHVRTLQAREFIMCFARSREGLPFRSPDEEPVHLFFGLVAPPYEDRSYLRVYQSLAATLLDPERFQEFLDAEDPSEILRVLETVG